MLKQTITCLRKKSQKNFQGSKIGIVKSFYFSLRRNISSSADFMLQFRAFFCHACTEISQYFFQDLIANFLNFLKTFKKCLQDFLYFVKNLIKISV